MTEGVIYIGDMVVTQKHLWTPPSNEWGYEFPRIPFFVRMNIPEMLLTFLVLVYVDTIFTHVKEKWTCAIWFCNFHMFENSERRDCMYLVENFILLCKIEVAQTTTIFVWFNQLYIHIFHFKNYIFIFFIVLW